MKGHPEPWPVASSGHDAGDDERMVEALRRGDDDAFTTLVRRHTPEMVRLAAGHVPSHAVAEEVVQDTWLAVLRAVDRFEGRSSLRTWILRILVNRARTHGSRERRSIPIGGGAETDDATPGGDRSRRDGAFSGLAGVSAELPEHRLLAAETGAVIRRSIAALPEGQRVVITLRDVEGWDAADVCRMLDLADGSQRVLLHRARCQVRRTLARHLET